LRRCEVNRVNAVAGAKRETYDLHWWQRDAEVLDDEPGALREKQAVVEHGRVTRSLRCDRDIGHVLRCKVALERFTDCSDGSNDVGCRRPKATRYRDAASHINDTAIQRRRPEHIESIDYRIPRLCLPGRLNNELGVSLERHRNPARERVAREGHEPTDKLAVPFENTLQDFAVVAARGPTANVMLPELCYRL